MNDLMTKSFTNYIDLKKSAMKDLDLEAGDIQFTSTTPMDSDLSLFLQQAEQVKQQMSSIRDLLSNLQQANETSKSLHKSEPLKSLRSAINSDIVTVLKQARSIRSQLEEMDRANAANKRLSSQKEGTPIYRTRLAVTNGLRKKLKELMMDFQALRERMIAEHKDTVARRYFTVTGENPDEAVIEKIIGDGDGGEAFLERAIMEHGRGKVMETVVEIKDRYGAAKEIERSLMELHQVFLDMAVMVETQGEKMDDIEHHVVNAAQYMKDGTKELHCAKKHQRASRKLMCFAFVLLLVIFLVIFIPITTSFSQS